MNTSRLIAVVEHAKGKVVQQHAKGKVEQQHAKGKRGAAACTGKGGAADKGQKGTALTCSSLGNGSKGYEQDQQLRAGEVQQAGRAPPGEEERR